MHLFRRTPLPDRRAARLIGLSAPSAGRPAPAAIADPSGLAALGRVLAAYEPERLLGRGEAREADRALRAAAHRLTAEARAQDPARAERLLIALKRAWPTLPRTGPVSTAGAERALWDRLVGLCCEEFYAPDRAGAPAVSVVPAAAPRPA